MHEEKNEYKKKQYLQLTRHGRSMPEFNSEALSTVSGIVLLISLAVYQIRIAGQ